MKSHYEECPPTDCPVCHTPEEYLTECLACRYDAVCSNHGCTNPACKEGLQPPRLVATE